MPKIMHVYNDIISLTIRSIYVLVAAFSLSCIYLYFCDVFCSSFIGGESCDFVSFLSASLYVGKRGTY